MHIPACTMLVVMCSAEGTFEVWKENNEKPFSDQWIASLLKCISVIEVVKEEKKLPSFNRHPAGHVCL